MKIEVTFVFSFYVRADIGNKAFPSMYRETTADLK
jgi:hypothetical protein